MHGQAYLCSEPPRTFSQVTRDFLVPGSVAFSPSSFYSLFRPSLTPPTGRCGAVVPATAPASSTLLRGTGALRANTSPQLSAPSTPAWPWGGPHVLGFGIPSLLFQSIEPTSLLIPLIMYKGTLWKNAHRKEDN